MFLDKLKARIQEPKPAGLDAPETTEYHRDLILGKPFLRKIYIDWYSRLIRVIGELPEGHLLEIGSGGGFLKLECPEMITSDILPISHCDLCCSASDLPFEDASVAGLFMVDVLHHIPNVRDFFAEAQRVLKPGGRIVMIEPANTVFARFIYQNLHHEDFKPEVTEWHFDSSGALSGANGALPWLVFKRDRALFQSLYPSLTVDKMAFHTPFRYLLSGGLSYRFPIPGFAHGLVQGLEWLLSPLSGFLAMFQTIQVVKQGDFIPRYQIK